jgi:hypothetical protein
MHFYREEITPDFWHFITCLTEEEGHYICCFIYWMIYKCFLLDAYTIESSGAACNQRIKAAGRNAVLECILALIYSLEQSEARVKIAGSGLILIYALYVIGVNLAFLRYKYSYFTNPILVFFTVYYLTCNFLVNLVDFVWNKTYLDIEFHMDDEINTSFSYRVYELVLFMILAFISTMLLCPPKDSKLRKHFEDF